MGPTALGTRGAERAADTRGGGMGWEGLQLKRGPSPATLAARLSTGRTKVVRFDREFPDWE